MKFIVSPGDHHDESFYLTDFQRSREGVILEAQLHQKLKGSILVQTI